MIMVIYYVKFRLDYGRNGNVALNRFGDPLQILCKTERNKDIYLKDLVTIQTMEDLLK